METGREPIGENESLARRSLVWCECDSRHRDIRRWVVVLLRRLVLIFGSKLAHTFFAGNIGPQHTQTDCHYQAEE